MYHANKAERFQALHRGSAHSRQPRFPAIATTSAGLAFMLGQRDGQAAVSRSEALTNAADILMATDLPVSADPEDGYGADPAACAEIVRRAADAGLCGFTIERTRPPTRFRRSRISTAPSPASVPP